MSIGAPPPHAAPNGPTLSDSGSGAGLRPFPKRGSDTVSSKIEPESNEVMRFLLTVNEPILPDHGRIAGLQVRVYEMAHALLAAGCDVAVLGPEERNARAPWAIYPTARAARSFNADAWICAPLLIRRHRDMLGTAPVLLDCYEAPFGSYLNFAATQPRRNRRAAGATFRREISQYLWALTLADGALVANERQRAAIAGLLALVGRLDPLTSVEGQVLLVPSGAPPAPLRAPKPPHEERPIVLWAGGAYPWFTLGPLSDTFRRIVDEVPGVRFRLAGLHGRDGAVGVRQVQGKQFLNDLARDLVFAGRVEDIPWAPYAKRVEQYDEASVAVSCHGQHLETYFSMRTRLLDVVWAGVPLVTTGGDELSGKLRDGGAAVVSHDASLAEDVIALLGDPVRRVAMAESSRALREGALGWRNMIIPLLTRPFGDQPPAPRDPGGGLAALRVPGVRRRQLRERIEHLAQRVRLRVSARG